MLLTNNTKYILNSMSFFKWFFTNTLKHLNWFFFKNAKQFKKKINAKVMGNKKFYRRFFKFQFVFKKIIPTTNAKNSAFIWTGRTKNSFGLKNLFHLKCVLDLEEFYIYDLYNYYAATTNLNKFYFNSETLKARYKLWKKFNFFYNIRRSVNKVRSYFSVFYGITGYTEKKLNTVFWGLRGVSTLGYTWFLEFNVTFVIIRLKYASSVEQSHLMLQNSIVFLDNNTVDNMWEHINIGQSLNIVFAKSGLLLLKKRILLTINSQKNIKNFIKNYYFSFFMRHNKPQWLTQRAKKLYFAKAHFFKFIESDYKCGKNFLIPYINPSVYFNYIQFMWSNSWNYRINTWKYRS